MLGRLLIPQMRDRRCMQIDLRHLVPRLGIQMFLGVVRSVRLETSGVPLLLFRLVLGSSGVRRLRVSIVMLLRLRWAMLVVRVYETAAVVE